MSDTTGEDLEQYSEVDLKREFRLRQARRASIGGFIFMGMIILGLVFKLTLGINFSNAQKIPEGKIIAMYLGSIIGIIIEAVLVAFWAYRVRIGRGFLSAIMLTVLFLIELLAKVTGGTIHALAFPLYLYLGFCMYEAIVSTWSLRRISERP